MTVFLISDNPNSLPSNRISRLAKMNGNFRGFSRTKYSESIYPNTTTLHYNLPQKFTNAEIIIADQNGKQLKQINISGMGKGTVNVDASMLSAGAYHYSLYADGKLIGSKQMVVAK
jgi:hypothetical protein